MAIGEAPERIEPESINDYLEVMSKAVFQSGISWKVVEAKWPSIREAFQDFDAQRVADFSEFDIEELTQDKRVIRHGRKLNAIVGNARKMLELEHEHGSFRNYLRSHGDFDTTLTAIRRDFSYMGPTGIYFFLYVVGEDVPSHEAFMAAYRK
jgi:3-methyladenine DNA glycosylase Tag